MLHGLITEDLQEAKLIKLVKLQVLDMIISELSDYDSTHKHNCCGIQSDM